MTRKEFYDALIESQGSWSSYSAGQMADIAEVMASKYSGNVPQAEAQAIIDRVRRVGE